MVETGSGKDELSIDWDNLLENIPHDSSLDFLDQSNSTDDIEQYVPGDKSNYAEKEDPIVIEDGFSSDILLDSPSRPELAQQVATNQEGKETDKSPEDEEPNDIVDAAEDDDDDNDPDMKKRKRQMRNKEAAVRSRERKKMHVMDLETKSKYYEGECKRLGVFLQCCLVENQALHLSLHGNSSSKAYVAHDQAGVCCAPVGVGKKRPPPGSKKLKAGNKSRLSQGLLRPSPMNMMMDKKYKASRSRMRKKVEAAEIHGLR